MSLAKLVTKAKTLNLKIFCSTNKTIPRVKRFLKKDYEIFWVPYVFWILMIYWMYGCHEFSPILFCFIAGAIGSHLTDAQASAMSFPLYLLGWDLQFQVLSFESRTQFELLFVFAMRSASNDLRVDIWISWHHLLKGLSCPHCLFFVTDQLTINVWLYF